MSQRLLIIGGGISGIGVAILAATKAWKVLLSDNGYLSAVQKEELSIYDIQIEEGGHDKAFSQDFDLIVKSPGVPPTVELVKYWKSKGVPIISEIEFAFNYINSGKVIGITGTNGKTTTTHLLYHVLKEGGLNCAMVGNVGFSFAKQIAINPKDWYVLELSSFQLEDIEKFKPEIAVILNLSEDHLDRYAGMEEYLAAKFNIIKNQTEENLLVLNGDDNYLMDYVNHHPIKPQIALMTMKEEQFNSRIGAFLRGEEVVFKHEEEYTEVSVHDLALKGNHNLYNTMAAGVSANALGIRNEKLRDSFMTMNSLEHRLEPVATIKGVEFINDSKATNLNSVWFAVESMRKPTVLIMGGKDKGNDYTSIDDVVLDKVHTIICLGVDNTAIVNHYTGKIDTIVETDSMIEAVNVAYEIANEGDVVLLSPGCASFDLFENFEDRGNQFKDAVLAL